MSRELGRDLTYGLGASCAVLAAIALLQFFGIGGGYRLLPDEPAPLEVDLTQPLRQMEFKLPDYGLYAEIGNRTLFTSDRKPRPIEASGGPAVPGDVPPPAALNATLLGIMLADGKRVALLRDNTTSAVSRVAEGNPLPGEMSGWTVKHLEARKAVLDGGPAQGEQELKLDMGKAPSGAPMAPPVQPVATAAPVPPGGVPQPVQPGMAPNAATQPAVAANAQDAQRQAEIQKIIEQRRAQMRAEAERMSAQQKQ